ncbi:MAG: hypothetical protein KME40_12290 [Komarekiella atlantica HA4396-MV6]|nr:hypothetical protein [Komarekiella atlantica HA4396-MV6]
MLIRYLEPQREVGSLLSYGTLREPAGCGGYPAGTPKANRRWRSPPRAKSSVGEEKSERRRPAIRTSGFPNLGTPLATSRETRPTQWLNFSRQASQLRCKHR